MTEPITLSDRIRAQAAISSRPGQHIALAQIADELDALLRSQQIADPAEVLELRQRVGTAQEVIAGHRLLIAGGEQEIAALKPRKISDPAELEALPDDAIVVGRHSVGWQMTDRDYDGSAIWEAGTSGESSTTLLAGGPVILVWVPTPTREGDSPSTGSGGGSTGGSDPSALIAEGRRMLAAATTPLPWWVGPDGDIYGSDGHADSPLVAENPERDGLLLAWAATNLPALLDALESVQR